jgi:hypothetical protein
LETLKNIECHKSVIVLESNPGETKQNESETEAGNPFGQRAIAVMISLKSHSRYFLRATSLPLSLGIFAFVSGFWVPKEQ